MAWAYGDAAPESSSIPESLRADGHRPHTSAHDDPDLAPVPEDPWQATADHCLAARAAADAPADRGLPGTDGSRSSQRSGHVAGLVQRGHPLRPDVRAHAQARTLAQTSVRAPQ